MIIGVAGLKRHGKDSVASFLDTYFGYTRIAFADPIKDIAKIAFRWTDVYMDYYKEDIDPKWGISPRQVFNSIGNDWAQHLLRDSFPRFSEVTGRSLWVENCFARMKELSETSGIIKFCISDVRYYHEVSAIKNAGGIIVKVIRPSLFGKNTDFYESESYINKLECDHTIINDGTLEQLGTKVRELFTEVL